MASLHCPPRHCLENEYNEKVVGYLFLSYEHPFSSHQTKETEICVVLLVMHFPLICLLPNSIIKIITKNKKYHFYKEKIFNSHFGLSWKSKKCFFSL